MCEVVHPNHSCVSNMKKAWHQPWVGLWYTHPVALDQALDSASDGLWTEELGERPSLNSKGSVQLLLRIRHGGCGWRPAFEKGCAVFWAADEDVDRLWESAVNGPGASEFADEFTTKRAAKVPQKDDEAVALTDKLPEGHSGRCQIGRGQDRKTVFEKRNQV